MLNNNLILSYLANSGTVSLSKLLNGISYQPSNKSEWAFLFRLLEELEDNGYIGIIRNNERRIESIKLLEDNKELSEIDSWQEITVECRICKKDIIEKDLVEYMKKKCHFRCMIDYIPNKETKVKNKKASKK